jgi:hypothetical protein
MEEDMKKNALLFVFLLVMCVLFNFDFVRNSNAGVVSSKSEGTLIEYTGCKDNADQDADASEVAASNQDCLEYEYDPEKKTLFLTHINAAFNCCPHKIDAEIEFAGQAITLTEFEEGGLCDCNCLYDLKYQFRNIDPGQYTITVYEPYVRQGDTILQCDIDLDEALTGKCCVTREYYPWNF